MERVYFNNYSLSYRVLDEVENTFLLNIINYIINHPLDWYFFLENVIKNKNLVEFSDQSMIVAYRSLSKQQLNSFNHFYNLLFSNNVIFNLHQNDDFLIIIFYSTLIKNFFEKNGQWLEYLTYYACIELGLYCFNDILITTDDGKINNVDVWAMLDSSVFIFKCFDSYKYCNADFENLFNIQKKLNTKSNIILIYTKDSSNFKKDARIELLKYKYNYSNFKEQLQEIIIRKFINL